jgi:hypothetical protein
MTPDGVVNSLPKNSLNDGVREFNKASIIGRREICAVTSSSILTNQRSAIHARAPMHSLTRAYGRPKETIDAYDDIISKNQITLTRLTNRWRLRQTSTIS